MDDKALDRLFSGDLNQLVPLPKRVVRLFISSTFTDMMLERNILMERVYPRLKKYCRERHGLDFQVVDMRWGVRDEATDDHQTANLCSREIENCQRMSLGPNFVALIGDKYGFRPLCNKIKSTEYRALRRCLIELDMSADFLDTWYKEDLNAVPAEYLLQPISSILKNFTNKNEPELQSVDQRIWRTIQQRLHELLMIGSSRLVEQGRMSRQEQLMKYSISVTEREVIEGCLDVKEAKLNCLVYVRSIVDIRHQLSECLADTTRQREQHQQQPVDTPANIMGASKLGKTEVEKIIMTTNTDDLVASKESPHTDECDTGHSKGSKFGGVGKIGAAGRNEQRRPVERLRSLLGKFIDLNSAGQNVCSLDDEAQNLLGHLRAAKLETKLGASKALSKFQVHWDESEGMSLKSEEHRRYLNELTDHFYMNMTKMIRRAARDDQEFKKSGLVGEVLQHSHYAKHVSRSFYGRSNELDRIHSYILGGNSTVATVDSATEPMPMFVYGVGGSGKTSVLARAATMAKDWIGRAKSPSSGAQSQQTDERWYQRPCIIMRFCCTTPSSSSMVGVLTSVCRQLQYNLYQFGPLNSIMNQAKLESRPPGGSFKGTAGEPSGQLHGDPQLAYEPIPEDFVRLVFTFRQLVENCRHHYHRARLFVIILDSVERLSSPSDSNLEVKYSWLTGLTQLPANVRLIVSCSSERIAASNSQADFVHLKRHFLRLYLPLDTGENVCDPIELRAGGKLGQRSDYSSMDTTALAARSLSIPDRSRGSLASHLLKKLVLPAIRLRRGSQKLRPRLLVANQGAESGEHALKRAASSLGIAQSRNEPHKNVDPPTAKSKDANPIEEARGRPASSSERVGCASQASSLASQTEAHLPVGWDNVAAADRVSVRKGEQTGRSAVNMVHVRPMGVDLALSVVRLWLQEMGRTLSQQQWSIARRSFAQCSRPIFVKLTFGEIVNWKSYSVQSDSKGLTFGSSILEALRGDRRRTAADDPQLRLLMGHSGQAQSQAQFERQIMTTEREWLGYLGHSQRKAEPASGQDVARGSAAADSDLFIRLLGGDNSSRQQLRQVGGGGGARGWNGGIALASNICHLSGTIDEAVSQLFARIELQHGYLLTKHSLSYITAARNGICENELEDVLSLDDVVLDDVFQYHFPPVRRIPPLLWTRIRNDLADYLSERDADGIVVNWHHNQFQLVARRRYLNEIRQVQYIHWNMADYFMGRWADVPKPFSCTRQQMLLASEQLDSSSPRDSSSLSSPTAGGRFVGSAASGRPSGPTGRASRLRSSGQSDKSAGWRLQAKADRRVPLQPIHYDSVAKADDHHGQSWERAGAKLQQNSRQRRYNLRKLTELPHHLMRCGRFLDLANEVLFNYKWLYAAIDATGLQSLLADFLEASDSIEAALGEQAAAEAKGGHSPPTSDSASPPSAERKKGDLSTDALRSMLAQLSILNNTIRLSSSAIHSDTQMLAPQLIGRLLPLVRQNSCTSRRQPTTGEHQSGQTAYLVRLLEQCDRDGCLDCSLLPTDHCLQAPNGLQLSSLEGHSFGVLSMRMAADQRHLLAVSNRFIMWDIATGEVSRDIDPRCAGSIMMELKMGSNDEYAIAYTSDNFIIVLDILTQQVAKFNASGHTNRADEGRTDDEKIIGLELVDLFGADKFVVWTRKRWIIMRIDKSEAQIRSASMPQRMSIAPVDDIVLAELEFDESHNLAPSTFNIQRVLHDDKSRVSLVLAHKTGEPCATMHLLTFSHGRSTGDTKNSLTLWGQLIEAGSLCLDPSLRQLVFADHHGDLFLSRRRNSHWSRPKPIRSEGQLDDNSTMVDEGSRIYPTPLAIELDSNWTSSGRGGWHRGNNADDGDSVELAAFEQRVDGVQVDDELGSSALLSGQRRGDSANQGSSRAAESKAGHVTTILLYLSDRIVVVRLDTGQRRCLILPRDIRNISVEPNKCQIRAIILGAHLATGGFLAATAGRRLLLYSLAEGQFLRSIDAHAGRIVQLMPIAHRPVGTNEPADMMEDDRWLSFASASLDKTVKIWNLSNLGKDVHTLDRLDTPIESMSLARQRPWVACLGRSELGLWDWRTMRLLARLSQHDLAATKPGIQGDNNKQSQPKAGSRLVKCRLSSDGRHLCLASLKWIHLYALEKVPAPNSRLELKLCAQHQLPDGARVRQFRFFQKDSRLLTSVECPATGATMDATSQPSEDTLSMSSGDRNSPMAARRLNILCHSIPDGRLLYTIVSITPTIQQNPSDRLATHHQESNRIRLPVLTRDQLHVVTVESGSASEENSFAEAPMFEAPAARKRSSGARLPTLLAVYSARDGLLLRRINLDQLEPYNLGPDIGRQTQLPDSAQSAVLPAATAQQRKLQPRPSVGRESFFNLSAELRTKAHGQQVGRSVVGDQFTRLKSVASYRERQSVVALLDDERSSSFLVDVNTRQLMAMSGNWNGKLSANGRFGLSRMFKSAGSLRSATAAQATNQTSPQTAATAGLQLLEMGHSTPVKTLLAHETLAQLSTLRREIGGPTGNDTDITCGFAGPNDSHVFYHDSRLAKLLLVRVRDAHLVANYKPAARVTKIKCSADGFALVLGLADGSLTTLAIVDPLEDDTVARLAQYPSRRRDNPAAIVARPALGHLDPFPVGRRQVAHNGAELRTLGASQASISN